MTRPVRLLRRIVSGELAFPDRVTRQEWNGREPWPASWITCATPVPAPFVAAYRLRFELSAPLSLSCHVSADERYELFLDGVRIARGPERGDILHWFYETYTGEIDAGSHVLVARVWSLGSQAPRAQVSVRHGFLFAAADPSIAGQFNTGRAPWDACVLAGYGFQSPLAAWGTGANVVVDGSAFAWGFERGVGSAWQPALVGPAANDNTAANVSVLDHVLTPAQLPAMLDEPAMHLRVRHVATAPDGAVSRIAIRQIESHPEQVVAWTRMFAGEAPVTIPPRSRLRVIADLENYACAYHHLTVSGGRGASVEIHWQESLYETSDAVAKGNRDAIEGKFFTTTWHLKDGIGDRFVADGGSHRRFESLWWHCGRFLQILVQTADEPLFVEELQLRETRYPLELAACFAAEPGLEAIVPLAWRTLQMCAHETYMDCPYFEQLQYAGDARIEALLTYVTARDDRLARKAVQMFDWSRTPTGLTQSHYPAGTRQIIPAFSLFWIGLVHDYLMWRDDAPLVRARLPGVRAVLDHWMQHVGNDGAIDGLGGWNTLDWVPTWKDGVPPDGRHGGGASFSFLLQIALQQAAEIEDSLGEPEIAARWRRRAGELRVAVRQLYWVEERALFADDRRRISFSEHAQSLAVLAGAVPEKDHARHTAAFMTDETLARTTIYFTHYHFEALRLLGRPERLLERLDLWRELRANGLKTTIEMPEPTRSDCHAWAAHPLFHFFATLLGVRPARPGFATVNVAPQLGSLEYLEGTLPHPRGDITVAARREGTTLRLDVALPDHVDGTLHYQGRTWPLRPGYQSMSLP